MLGCHSTQVSCFITPEIPVYVQRRFGNEGLVVAHALTRAPDEKINWRSSLPFLVFHAVPLLVFVTGVTPKAVAIFAALYVLRMLAITAGYHRYFAHRSYRASRPLQFALALIGTTAAQKGPLWWAGHHRGHHRNADIDADIHSPQKAFWWSHGG